MRWFRDTFHPGSTYDALAELSSQSPPGCDGLTFLPYLSGERCPHNDPFARGAFAGLTLRHGPEHIARSVFEGISFGLIEAQQVLMSAGENVHDVRVTGGGARSPFWLQMLADLLQAPCRTLASDEGPAYGAAILGGVGIGVWKDVETACRETVRFKEVTHPRPTDYSEARSRYAALYAATKNWNH